MLRQNVNNDFSKDRLLKILMYIGNSLKDAMHVVNWTSIWNTQVVMKDWKTLHTKNL